MNKPSIRFIKLNDGDVISTSGEPVSYVIDGLANGTDGDLNMTGSDGTSFVKSDFATGGTLANVEFYLNDGAFTLGYKLAQNEEAAQLSVFNGNYTYDSTSNKFVKSN